eukprot:13967282-Alexandrium_andersonii.AAC.1
MRGPSRPVRRWGRPGTSGHGRVSAAVALQYLRLPPARSWILRACVNSSRPGAKLRRPQERRGAARQCWAAPCRSWRAIQRRPPLASSAAH